MRRISAENFLQQLASVLHAHPPPHPPGPADWTLYMTMRFRDLAERVEAHLCSSTLGKLAGNDPQIHEPHEYLFDFTLFTDWMNYSLPAVIIEHENKWNEKAFMLDFWKLMLGHAPLRVMFGYASTAAGADKLVTRLEQHATDSAWAAPTDIEDLVLIGHGDMDYIDDWRVVLRRAVRWQVIATGLGRWLTGRRTEE
ncbi:hypothetical protein [Pendulispora albinea]|uniref:SIR2-like domain-containing protein n=1 Tax=Pendulispora albinea TaxID=2741071 RepID=A0ABZ2M3T5_9BACT